MAEFHGFHTFRGRSPWWAKRKLCLSILQLQSTEIAILWRKENIWKYNQNIYI